MITQSINLSLDIFEGPLDLLLYLIRKNDLEISRVSVSVIADQYLSFIETMEELNIDVAGDFIVMAAELAHIKSRTLLPGNQDEAEPEGDVASDLAAKLREYQRYKLAALQLGSRQRLGRDTFKRALAMADEDDPKSGEEKFEVDTFDLMRAFAEVLARLPKEVQSHEVQVDHVSVTERIYQILDRLKDVESLEFGDLFEGTSLRSEVITCFLAILEMARLRLALITQVGQFEPIRLRRNLDVTDASPMAANVVDDFRE